MAQQILDDKKDVVDTKFDHVVELISECVVIKAQLQQFMDDLDGERQRARATSVRIAQLTKILQDANKGSGRGAVDLLKPLAVALKEAETLNEGARASKLDTVVIAMDEAVARFSKVMGDLQHELVTMDLGSSAISILQVLLVKIDGEIYGLPIESVLEILKVKPGDIHSIDGNDTISLRGHALGVVNVCQVIGMPGAKAKEIAENKIVVVSGNGEQVGVIVDDLLGEESVVFKDLPVQVRGIRGLQGASILGDGRVGLIIDTARLIAMAGGKE